jgi:hypothetical protein
MSDVTERLAGLGVSVPELMLPELELNLQKWAVIACDQFSSDEAYWRQLGAFVDDAPSTLHLIYPEIYLPKSAEAARKVDAAASNGAENDNAARIKAIHDTMYDYARDRQILQRGRKACSYVVREVNGKRRRGVVLAIDLEQYDWKPGSEVLVRASEGTIESRIPPRMDIRRGAALELPHIILLIDDEDEILFPLIDNLLRSAPVAYAGPLYGDSGKVWGKLMRRENDWSFIANCLEHLARKAQTRYGGATPFLFAVGDGNHSLAAAKAVWEEYKAWHKGDPELARHPARWAMVEVENIYDAGMVFEPIHRVLFNTELDAVQKALDMLPGLSFTACESTRQLKERVFGDGGSDGNRSNCHRYGLIQGDTFILAEADAGAAGGAIATVGLEKALDSLLKIDGSIAIDYIHGEDELLRLAGGRGGDRGAVSERGVDAGVVGIMLPPINKKGLFETVAKNGVLPRKSFSMGSAVEKRFYLECRKLF